MQQVSAYFLIALFVGSLFMHSAIKIHFEWNRTEITELFCINKDEPELGCKGQCVLMKRLNEHKSGDGAPLTLPDNRTQNNWAVTESVWIPKAINSESTQFFGYILNQIVKRHLSIDVPPPKI